MSAQSDTDTASMTLGVAVSPDEVDAGGALTLTGEITPAPRDAEGREIVVRNEAGAEIARLPIVGIEDGTARTEPATVTAPAEAGACNWTAELPATEGGNDAITIAFTVTVVAHRVSLTVWDIPPTVPTGGDVTVKIGVKCSSACDSTGWPVEIVDPDGAVLATAPVGSKIWPGSDALRYVEVTLKAPATADRHAISARTTPGAGLPHAESAVTFSLNTVPPPEVRLTIAVTDERSGTPVAGAKIAAHPFRAVTNAEGLAEIDLPKGEYRVFVSGTRHLPLRRLVDVADSMTLEVALPFDAEPTEEELWT